MAQELLVSLLLSLLQVLLVSLLLSSLQKRPTLMAQEEGRTQTLFLNIFLKKTKKNRAHEQEGSRA